MLAVIRLVLLALGLVLLSVVATVGSLLRPFHRNNVHLASLVLGRFSKIIGLEVEIRMPDSVKAMGPAVYIANHQNNYDLFTISGAVPKNTVSVGKKSLKWIPFFGQMYWLTGNILIDRKNSSKAMNTIAVTAAKIREKKLSVWLFPEGTRSNGRGLLPFKTGAFRTAVQADVPIVPVCVSNLHGVIKLNRWNNGKMIIEFQEPIELDCDKRESIRLLAQKTHGQMLKRINEISHEAGTELPQANK
ncbi:1-acylglycerol-3-phosphate O-acyltransferase [Thalassomonas actiniarum]|uniref:1-acyl-sn-glycerol-3-phosphate acyltransferase n=1 Tax=Thalassomonas actiniarum TaxID=485447 RepID=A0AAE9YSQ1_9GAMM|nr:1-acylglycerol-3-phosphate O-acyltransferase [Thalassomonas actiniarum]WDD99584.1 1-acylglycerol-3-phosphate O-acyltransferase [Thalassomonas actiniarum]